MKCCLKNIIPCSFFKKKLTIPVVRLEKTIMPGGGNWKNDYLNLNSCADHLKKAFEEKNAPIVALLINSPGGSATQSHLIYNYIRQLAEQHNKKVIAFAEDVAASGGYMIACAADEIYADPTSIIGSIGVVSGGFGFSEAIKKLGIERRIYKAGKNKVTLDSFLPENPEDINHLNKQLLDIHKIFIDLVKTRRQNKIKDIDNQEDLFSGLFWTGVKAKELGLVDDCSNLNHYITENYGPDVQLKFMTKPKPFLSKILANFTPHNLVSKNLESLKNETLWSRYGL